MLKKIFFLAIVWLNLTMVAMERDTISERNMKPYQANTIEISTAFRTLKTKIQVNKNTTVLDVKKIIAEKEAIPVEQQILRPSERSKPLFDNENMKDAMFRYDTRHFFLSFSGRKRSSSK